MTATLLLPARSSSVPALHRSQDRGAPDCCVSRRALFLTTPRGQRALRQRRSNGQRRAQPQEDPLESSTGTSKSEPAVQAAAATATATPTATAAPRAESASRAGGRPGGESMEASIKFASADISGGDRDLNQFEFLMQENIRMRKREHQLAKELQETKDKLKRSTSELQRTSNTMDELRLKLSNLERIDRTKSAELLEERRNSDDLKKQVKAMGEKLLNILNQKGGNYMREATGLQKRCFKLVQEKTQLSVQSSLLRRQKGWAEAKARVLQDEVTKVYLGTHTQVKDNCELEVQTKKEFRIGNSRHERAAIYRPLLDHREMKNFETAIDFLTHVCHTRGELHSFLQSNRVYSEGIRVECLNALGREFYAIWNQNRRLPRLLRAVERLCHLADYLSAFESFTAEMMDLLVCGYAKIWVVDNVRNCLWTSTREGESGSRTVILPLPSTRTSEVRDEDLEGKGLAVAACSLQRIINVSDAHEDPRFKVEADASPNGVVRSVICVPVVRHRAGAADQVSVVIQAINKLEESHFDGDADASALRLLGKVSMEVMQSCLDNSAASTNAKRKDALLQLFNDQVPCTSPSQLLQALENGLRDVFMSQATALHVVSRTEYGAPPRSTRLQVNVSAGTRSVTKTGCEGLRGIIGSVARSRNQLSYATSTLADTPYDALVDLPVSGKTVLHSVPVCVGTECLAVVQFVCVEREAGSTGDDGYHPENTAHFKILRVLLNFVRNHLKAFAQKQECDDSEEVRDLRLGSKSKPTSTKRLSVLELNPRIKAAIVIQKFQRARVARIRVRNIRSQLRRSRALNSLQGGVRSVIAANSLAEGGPRSRRRRSNTKSAPEACA